LDSKYDELKTVNAFNLPNWKRLTSKNHEEYRFKWVADSIHKHCLPGSNILDVGCGRQPFREIIELKLVDYISHDFSGYNKSSKDDFGLHNIEVPKHEVDIVCDILEIPDLQKFDAVLCTEVFEHVPDPVKALEKMSQLLLPGGVAIITFPGMSWTHQAPYYFSSGLSPYWVEHHTSRLGLDVIEGVAVGEMRDLLKFVMPQIEVGVSGLFLRLIGKFYRFLAFRKKHVNFIANESAILQIMVVLRMR
jgi:SAM-dependent methyltransferase